MNLQRTPIETLRRARTIGIEAGLQYVYEGNVPGEGGENTYCPRCGELIMERIGYHIRQNKMKASHCLNCGTEIDGLFEKN